MWLQAVQDQKLFDSSQDLAKPINWGDEAQTCDGTRIKVEPDEESQTENQKRPTVLVCVQGNNKKQISSDDMQGAIALVELKNGQKSCVNYNYRL